MVFSIFVCLPGEILLQLRPGVRAGGGMSDLPYVLPRLVKIPAFCV
jgi:hypothetical protein